VFKKIISFLAPTKPPTTHQGDELTISRAKRQMERDLRAAGHSRTSAMTTVSKHFGNHLRGKP
jgi:hypothetical protein